MLQFTRHKPKYRQKYEKQDRCPLSLNCHVSIIKTSRQINVICHLPILTQLITHQSNVNILSCCYVECTLYSTFCALDNDLDKIIIVFVTTLC